MLDALEYRCSTRLNIGGETREKDEGMKLRESLMNGEPGDSISLSFNQKMNQIVKWSK